MENETTATVNTIEHISSSVVRLETPAVPTAPVKTSKEIVFEELNKAQFGLWSNLPPVEFFPGVWLGNVFNAQDLHFRHQYNIQTIINCATYEAQPQLMNIYTYICLNGSDEKNYKILEYHFDYVYDMIERSLERGHNVLLHCQCGVNRSATMAVAYLCKKTQCLIENAILDIFKQRPCILSNVGFREQLFEWAFNQYWINYSFYESVSLVEILSDNETTGTRRIEHSEPSQYNLVYKKKKSERKLPSDETKAVSL
jgi:hypothetical protein